MTSADEQHDEPAEHDQPAVCDVDGCTRPRMGRRRYCGRCYGRIRRYGDPHGRPGPRLAADLTGQRFGLLTVEHYDTERREWLCRCDCGRTRHVRASVLNLGYLHTCGNRRAHRTDTATYAAAHDRLRRDRGAADTHLCAAPSCTNRAAQWAYDHTDPHELTDDTGRPYSLDTARYRPLCPGCHTRADHARQTDQPGLWD